jgi:hypothetical protein
MLIYVWFQVTERLRKEFPNERKGFQVMSVDNLNFTKKLYFNPGLYDEIPKA